MFVCLFLFYYVCFFFLFWKYSIYARELQSTPPHLSTPTLQLRTCQPLSVVLSKSSATRIYSAFADFPFIPPPQASSSAKLCPSPGVNHLYFWIFPWAPLCFWMSSFCGKITYSVRLVERNTTFMKVFVIFFLDKCDLDSSLLNSLYMSLFLSSFPSYSTVV